MMAYIEKYTSKHTPIHPPNLYTPKAAQFPIIWIEHSKLQKNDIFEVGSLSSISIELQVVP